ncbi:MULTISPECIES: restriction endonuclease subunit S [unclassified Streptococcus]|uniref:restriction endonuclease subunit S n=1 Tax=unclassified Streptococcus TaxID=2608887 RepID=UPI001DAE7BA0|nr:MULTISPECIES: restriction endonuclease subunit S [unclassified Streptococcus]MBK5045050.1 restriction endonuclease subunit S [Streptococcus sp. 2.1]MBK5161503.1 restriction endonuclease subunit S [Streptococcus sp. 3.1]
MMISQRKNIPLVRVEGFEGAWELCTLGEHIEDYVEKTTVQNQYPVLTSSQNRGIVRQEDYFANRQVTTDSNIGYFVLPKGFFTYRSRSDNGVFKFNRNDIVEKGIISYFYPVFSIVEGDSDFYLKLLNTSITKQAMLQAEGTGQKVLSLRKFKSIKASVPSLAEQSAIGSLFRTLDDFLTSYKDNLANYQSLKANMLSKMFPKAGKTVPEIRLDRFEGEWEEKCIGEIADIVRGASPRPIQDPKWFDSNSEIGWLRISDVTSQNGRIHSLEQKISKLGQEKTRVLTEPHLLLSIAATVGKPVVNYVKTGVHDGFLIFMNPKFDREFMFQWLEMFRKKWNRYGQPGSQVNLNSDIVKNQKILIPCMEEQQAIGSYFSNLDNLINSHQEKISQLETLKKKLLQDMFI